MSELVELTKSERIGVLRDALNKLRWCGELSKSNKKKIEDALDATSSFVTVYHFPGGQKDGKSQGQQPHISYLFPPKSYVSDEPYIPANKASELRLGPDHKGDLKGAKVTFYPWEQKDE